MDDPLSGPSLAEPRVVELGRQDFAWAVGRLTLPFVYRVPALKVLTSWSGRLMGTQAWACKYFDRSECGFQGL